MRSDKRRPQPTAGSPLSASRSRPGRTCAPCGGGAVRDARDVRTDGGLRQALRDIGRAGGSWPTGRNPPSRGSQRGARGSCGRGVDGPWPCGRRGDGGVDRAASTPRCRPSRQTAMGVPDELCSEASLRRGAGAATAHELCGRTWSCPRGVAPTVVPDRVNARRPGDGIPPRAVRLELRHGRRPMHPETRWPAPAASADPSFTHATVQAAERA